MSLLCRFAGHRPVPSNIWNDGYYFSRCASCGCEMIGRSGRWQTVPKGYRVVWRRSNGEAIDWQPKLPAMPMRRDAVRIADVLALMPARSVEEGFDQLAAAGKEGVSRQPQRLDIDQRAPLVDEIQEPLVDRPILRQAGLR